LSHAKNPQKAGVREDFFYLSKNSNLSPLVRQIVAILLCGIFFFNWVGYRLLNDLLVEDATRRLDARLDQQEYNEDQLITIKVPLTSLAYFNNSAAFERSSGQIEINGIPCRYVKRRIYHDSLEMRCIPNQPAIQLRQSGNNYFNGVTGIERPFDSKGGSHPGARKSFQSDPYIGIAGLRPDAPTLCAVVLRDDYSAILPSLPLPADERPPAPLAA
jgi:hypothetical protein